MMTEKQVHREDSVKGEDYQVRLSVLVYTAAAIVMGYISLLISPLAGNMMTIMAGIAVAWVAGTTVQHLVGKKDIKWLIGNGIFIYVFVWLIAWIFFFNFFS